MQILSTCKLLKDACQCQRLFQFLHLTRVLILSQVPSLNDVPLHYMKPNSLVKFRCLIQDMFDPEFYMGAYEAVDPSTKAKVSASLSPVLIFAITILSCVQFSALIMCWMSSHFHLILLSGYPQVLKCGKYKDVMECGVSPSPLRDIKHTSM